MTAWVAQLTMDVIDVRRQAEFWSTALGFTAEFGDDGAATLVAPYDEPFSPRAVWLQPVTERKQEKLRLHLDLRPVEDDVEREVQRLLDLGASRADVGQTGEEGFVVLADPEGNEFCLLTSDPR